MGAMAAGLAPFSFAARVAPGAARQARPRVGVDRLEIAISGSNYFNGIA
jgi:hypothetical protein